MNSLYEWYKKQHACAHTKVEEWLYRFIANEQDASRRSIYTDALFPGRRIRSTLLCMLCGTTQSAQSNHLEKLTIALELLHRGSIILDDFIDGDIARRGVPTFHVRHGYNTTLQTVIQFIYQVLKVFTPNRTVYEFTAIAIQKMSVGQLADIGFLRSFGSFRSIYTYRVLQKTSEPFALIGAYASFLKNQRQNHTNTLIQTLRLFGRLYQIENDFYDDLCADKTERGTRSEFAGTVSLGSSIVLDCGNQRDQRIIKKALRPNREGLSPEYAEIYYRTIRKNIYVLEARKKCDRARRTLLNHIVQLPKTDKKLLTALYSWVTLPEF